MIADIQSWVVAYSARRYPSVSARANAHMATAWAALLDAGYGGNRTAGDGLGPAPQPPDASTADVNAALGLYGSPDSDRYGSKPTHHGGAASQRAHLHTHQPLPTPTHYSPDDGCVRVDTRIVCSFSKDGVARFPSLTLRTYTSPDPAGIVTAWRELIAAVRDRMVA